MTIDLACIIYVDTNSGELREILQQLPLKSSNDGEFFERDNSIEILKNLDYDSVKRQSFPDGFLHFRMRIEIFPIEPELIPLENQVDLISTVLRCLWSNGIPAVAACDYEESLPRNGGYKSIESYQNKNELGEQKRLE